MGNNSTKESRTSSLPHDPRPSSTRSLGSPTTSAPTASSSQPPAHRPVPPVYTSRSGRGSRHDLSFLGIGGGSERDASQPDSRRETKAEREARKLEKERAAREKERERSMREEGVDGGYLVTLGTYTGPEDFNKAAVRQLMIERRLAPFWKGLNDHSEAWVEHQLVAAVRGLPIPAADEVPPELASRSESQTESNPRASDLNINHLTVPMSSRSPSYNSEISSTLSPSHPAFSSPSPTSPFGSQPTSSPLFRGRAKTLASLTTSSRNNSQSDMTPQEIHLPRDPYVNGQPIEAFLYKDASECPICFLYYPPYLNKTRCCDQPICSECFVQIRRPDPHPPEHHDPANPDSVSPPPIPEEENVLVSEPAACPFCVQPEFGVTYDPPPFRRGLAYANQHGHALASSMSAMSSSSSLASGMITPNSTSRRRTTSLSANAPTVITTDRVRPDWAKKLSDARAHALRRSAAATALHNAAYVLGNVGASDSRGFGLGRRRRTMFGADSPGSSGNGTPRIPEALALSNMGALLAAAERHGSSSSGRGTEGHSDLLPGRVSSRQRRIEDLEELMMMEAIRLSLAAEEERKRKEDKQASKEAKKEEKKQAKEAKKAEKAERAARRKTSIVPPGTNDSRTSQAAVEMSTAPVDGKGKGVDRAGQSGFSPQTEPTSPLSGEAKLSKEDPQRHLEQRRTQIQTQSTEHHTQPNNPFLSRADSSSHRSALRQLSVASSSASSFAESVSGSLRNDHGFRASGSSFDGSPNTSGINIASGATTDIFRSETPPGGGAGTEPMLNFRSLAAVIVDEEKEGSRPQYIEDVAGHPHSSTACDRTRSRGDSGESSSSAPPNYVDSMNGAATGLDASAVTMRPSEDDVSPLQHVRTDAPNPYDQKHYGDVRVLGSPHYGQQTTQ